MSVKRGDFLSRIAGAPLAIPAIPGIDRTFALAAVEGNSAELAIARLAEQRAMIPEVKHFAEKMTTEHMGLDDDMRPTWN